DLVAKGAGADVACTLAVDGARAFVVGSGGAACRASEASNCDWLIRTYELKSGALLWEKEVDGGGGDDTPTKATVQGNRLVVIGYAQAAFAAEDLYLVPLAYDARDGSLLWD